MRIHALLRDIKVAERRLTGLRGRPSGPTYSDANGIILSLG